ncbi:unnamed protein product [Urochloa decumbens]|uniref:Sulfotransferase n=1 Tax=Urochloa decumbens TaxID=240449 RepID=A0ABC9BV84_9POAL
MAADAPQQVEKKLEQSVSEEGETYSSLLTSTLPTTQDWATPLFRLQGCWLTRQCVESVRLVDAQFKPRPDDLLLATYPKSAVQSLDQSGTTWLKALAFTILNRSRRHPVVFTGAGAGDNGHPLLSHNPHDLVPFLEMPDRALNPVAELEALPSPRLLCTHLPAALLPPATLGLGCRVVYLCRDPKDVLVSLWYHMRSMPVLQLQDSFQFTNAFDLFCEGVSLFGPVWEHCLGYWKGSLEPSNNVLFFKYDEMMAQAEKHVKTLAGFLGVPSFTADEESGGAVEGVVRLCSFHNLKNLPVNSDGVVADRIGALPTKNSMFFRKGKVVDWENHLTQEMAHKLDSHH